MQIELKRKTPKKRESRLNDFKSTGKLWWLVVVVEKITFPLFSGGVFFFFFFPGFFFIYIKSHFRFHNLFLTIYIYTVYCSSTFFLSFYFYSFFKPNSPFFFQLIITITYIYRSCFILFYFILLQLFIDYQSFHLFNPSSTTTTLPPHNYIHNFQCLQHW